jgi:Transposase DNA-binding
MQDLQGSSIGRIPLDGRRILCGDGRGWASVAILEVGMESQVDSFDSLGSFGQRNFGNLELGHKRRTARLVETVDLMCRHPGGTLPDKLNRPADLRAFYRLMRRPEVTHDVLIRGHADYTRARIAELAEQNIAVLILHDATELDFTSKTTVSEHMSQIGMGTRRGYICHNSLAVRADTGAVLGLTSQILHNRARVPKKETPKQRRERANRESRLWVQGAQATGPAPAGVRCIDVSDSLSDTFEYIAFEINQGRRFVLRQKEDRRLHTPLKGHHYLKAATQALPAQSERSLRVLASPGRSARKTTVKIAFAKVQLAVPCERHGAYVARPLEVWVIRIWEPVPPAGEEPLEWILLTNVPTACAEDAHERVSWYEQRPIIEEYHKGKKTGCRIESMQFDAMERLEPAIAVLSVVTTTLLQLRDAARAPDADQRLATEVIGSDYVDVLANHYGNRLGPKPTILKFYLHVARLGGHQNRKVDGFPGWLTLWRGWERLQSMVDGYHTGLRRRTKTCGTN